MSEKVYFFELNGFWLKTGYRPNEGEFTLTADPSKANYHTDLFEAKLWLSGQIQFGNLPEIMKVTEHEFVNSKQ